MFVFYFLHIRFIEKSIISFFGSSANSSCIFFLFFLYFIFSFILWHEKVAGLSHHWWNYRLFRCKPIFYNDDFTMVVIWGAFGLYVLDLCKMYNRKIYILTYHLYLLWKYRSVFQCNGNCILKRTCSIVDICILPTTNIYSLTSTFCKQSALKNTHIKMFMTIFDISYLGKNCMMIK